MANALAQEKSPYLLQHAHNPVDWMPWGEAAFERARREDKLIFLSIGYSTCHWCHVMERESFESDSIAALMNEHFVNIKVDREERPDVDATYMAFVNATTGHGGWPMSVWLTPELRPIYGGTYYPPDDRAGRTGFPTLLRRLAEVWRNERGNVIAGSERAIDMIKAMHEVPEPTPALPSDDVFAGAFDQLARTYDPNLGGFGRAPKFPRAALYLLLARLHRRFGGASSQRGQRCLRMLNFTLSAMAQGGIHDHLGGGFHRYAVDAYWHVPHFEKMLYDQAQLAVNYIEAWQLTDDPLFRDTAEGIFSYVLRDLTDPLGGFYSAEDADSLINEGDAEKAEGGFYTWTHEEVHRLLSADLAQFFCLYYWVKSEGNARPESDPLGELEGRNTLFVAQSVEEVAKELQKSAEEVRAMDKAARELLFAARQERPRPHKDDKIIVAWNGLMISAFAKGAAAFARADYVDAARRALRFIHDHLFDETEGTLRRSFREGASEVPGFADDYAFLIQACLDLYEAAGDAEWLRWAVRLQERMDELFWDATQHGYVLTARGQKDTLVALKQTHDGAEPSPNSIAAGNLLRLAAMLDSGIFRERAELLLRSVGEMLAKHPFGMPCMVAALDFARGTPAQIVLTQGENESALRAAVHRHFMPDKVVLAADGGVGQIFLSDHVPTISGMKPIDGKAAAFICQNFTCEAPDTDPDELARRLTTGPASQADT
ncbi:MAG: thioredoxin domain-containing protein [Verrucomicrobiales bacterium]